MAEAFVVSRLLNVYRSLQRVYNGLKRSNFDL